MNPLRSEPAAPARLPLRLPLHAACPVAREAESPWEARGFADLVPPDTLAQARARRDGLARLLRREREAAADFLLALADFDRRRGWEPLGYASLFAFLTRELGLSNSAAWYRQAAARLLPRFPAVEAALRDGRLCLSVVGDLARVLTPQNETEVLPRFLGTSSREAKEVVAAILPCPNPPRRDAVLRNAASSVVAVAPSAEAGSSSDLLPRSRPVLTGAAPAPALGAAPSSPGIAPPQASGLFAGPLLAPEVAPTHPARGARDEVEPLTAELRRLCTTVSARFLQKLATARDDISHSLPRATTEQVLETALDLLLEQQARRKSLVKRPREVRTGLTHPRRIPAAVEREVRLRDGDRCQYPLDSGGICGSTRQVELDHLVPLALGGPTTVANLRCACATHNRYAAERELGAAVVETGRRWGRRRQRGPG